MFLRGFVAHQTKICEKGSDLQNFSRSTDKRFLAYATCPPDLKRYLIVLIFSSIY